MLSRRKIKTVVTGLGGKIGVRPAPVSKARALKVI